MSAAFDMWFDRNEAEMLAQGARGLYLEELPEIRRSFEERCADGDATVFPKTDDETLAYFHAVRMERIAAGKCPVHAAPLAPGKRCCERCLQAQARIRAQRKAATGSTKYRRRFE